MLVSTLREAPGDAAIISHKLMFRAGLIRKLSNGLFAYLPLGLRVKRKVEQIVREEMNAIGAQEFLLPVVVPGEVWKESGRWTTMGDGMLKVKNRLGQDLVVSPTAEEAITSIIRDELFSYKQLPIVTYQIQTKFRDEIRPRYGVMRGREFTMKDAYSFHADDKSLDEIYGKFAQAYRNVFRRCGLTVIPVSADSGAFGGSGSEEFMIESEIGDNTLILCKKCGYAANDEKAVCASDLALDKDGNPQKTATQPIEKVACAGVETIAQMEEFFKMPASQFIKVLIYRVENSEIDFSSAPGGKTFKRDGNVHPEVFVAVAIRGDLDVNEAKLAAFLKASAAELADEENVIKYSGAPHGFVGPVGLTNVPLIADFSVMEKIEDGFKVNVHDTVTGGGVADFDNMHVEPVRDFVPFLTGDVRTVKAGDICPNCGEPFFTKKGNELGHIFKLGTKYSKALKAKFLDENGKEQIPTMGCYGIGIDRTVASIIEENNDENGIIWPMSVAPFSVTVVPIKGEQDTLSMAENLYEDLKKRGLEVLLDDRNERPGVKFKDLDLMGIPIRVVISDKTLPDAEIRMRQSGEVQKIPLGEVGEFTEKIIRAQMENYK